MSGDGEYRLCRTRVESILVDAKTGARGRLVGEGRSLRRSSQTLQLVLPTTEPQTRCLGPFRPSLLGLRRRTTHQILRGPATSRHFEPEGCTQYPYDFPIQRPS